MGDTENYLTPAISPIATASFNQRSAMGDTERVNSSTYSACWLVLRATLIEHSLAELDEQAVETKQGAEWLPGRWGRGIY
jgi:hypothetical protein